MYYIDSHVHSLCQYLTRHCIDRLWFNIHSLCQYLIMYYIHYLNVNSLWQYLTRNSYIVGINFMSISCDNTEYSYLIFITLIVIISLSMSFLFGFKSHRSVKVIWKRFHPPFSGRRPKVPCHEIFRNVYLCHWRSVSWH